MQKSTAICNRNMIIFTDFFIIRIIFLNEFTGKNAILLVSLKKIRILIFCWYFWKR